MIGRPVGYYFVENYQRLAIRERIGMPVFN